MFLVGVDGVDAGPEEAGLVTRVGAEAFEAASERAFIFEAWTGEAGLDTRAGDDDFVTRPGGDDLATRGGEADLAVCVGVAVLASREGGVVFCASGEAGGSESFCLTFCRTLMLCFSQSLRAPCFAFPFTCWFVSCVSVVCSSASLSAESLEISQGP